MPLNLSILTVARKSALKVQSHMPELSRIRVSQPYGAGVSVSETPWLGGGL